MDQSVGGVKSKEPREKPPATPAVRTWLVSQLCALLRLEPTPDIEVKTTQPPAPPICFDQQLCTHISVKVDPPLHTHTTVIIYFGGYILVNAIQDQKKLRFIYSVVKTSVMMLGFSPSCIRPVRDLFHLLFDLSALWP